MKKLDNIELIKPLIDFPNNDTFYFIQIMRRAKDHPELDKKFNKIIRNYFVYSQEEFENIIPHVIRHCEEAGARGYIRLNKRSAKLCGYKLIKKVADLMTYRQFAAIPDAYTSIAGEFHSDPDKKWLLDFDFNNKDDHFRFEAVKAELKEYIKLEVPSFNGIHLITSPFRLDEYKELLNKYKVDFHKDSPTILFAVIP